MPSSKTAPLINSPGMQPAAPAQQPAAPDSTKPAAVDLSEESVAGEEDPGAALDLLWPLPGRD